MEEEDNTMTNNNDNDYGDNQHGDNANYDNGDENDEVTITNYHNYYNIIIMNTTRPIMMNLKVLQTQIKLMITLTE